MKHKKTAAALFLTIGIVAVGGAGFLAGNITSGQSGAGRADHADDISVKAESTLIAVVNMDEGIDTGKGKVNYAESISRFPSVDFEYSSLEQAKAGFENGIYGAYIIIPATFSQSVESINSTPETSWLEFAVNQSYSGKTQYGLLYNVVSYAENLNNSLSYMYVSNILTEFHDAQDGAETIMANDIRDKEAVDQIEAYDLVALIPTPEMTQVENTTQPLDITEYTQNNTELAQGIDDQYMACVEEIQIEIKMLGESGVQLSDILTRMSEEISEIDITVDEEGTPIAEQADAALSDALSGYADNLAGKINTAADDSDYIKENLERSVSVYNDNLQKNLSESVGKYKTDVISSVPDLILESDGNGGYVLRCDGQDSPELKIYVDNSGATIGGDGQNDSQSLMQKIAEALCDEQAEKETVQVPVAIGESAPGAGDARELTVDYEADRSVKTVLSGWDKEAQALGYDSAADFLEQYDYSGSGADGSQPGAPAFTIVCEGDVGNLTEYIKQKIGETELDAVSQSEFSGAIYDENGAPVTDAETGMPLTVWELVGAHSSMLQELENAVSEEKEANISSVQELIRQEYIIPVEGNAQKAEEQFVQKNEEQKEQISAYNDELSGFSPVINSQFLSENSAEMSRNNAQIQEALAKNSAEYMEYATQVFEAAEENVTTLEQTIIETKESSDEAVESALGNAKDVKSQTSSQNQEILADFALKLPFTRLGNAEYTQAYQFVANPVSIEDISGEGAAHRSVSPGTARSSTKQDEARSDILWKILYAAGWAAVLVLMILLVVNTVRHRKGQ